MNESTRKRVSGESQERGGFGPMLVTPGSVWNASSADTESGKEQLLDPTCTRSSQTAESSGETITGDCLSRWKSIGEDVSLWYSDLCQCPLCLLTHTHRDTQTHRHILSVSLSLLTFSVGVLPRFLMLIPTSNKPSRAQLPPCWCCRWLLPRNGSA